MLQNLSQCYVDNIIVHTALYHLYVAIPYFLLDSPNKRSRSHSKSRGRFLFLGVGVLVQFLQAVV